MLKLYKCLPSIRVSGGTLNCRCFELLKPGHILTCLRHRLAWAPGITIIALPREPTSLSHHETTNPNLRTYELRTFTTFRRHICLFQIRPDSDCIDKPSRLCFSFACLPVIKRPMLRTWLGQTYAMVDRRRNGLDHLWDLLLVIGTVRLPLLRMND